MDPALIQEFVLEATDSLQKVEQDLLALERTSDPAAVGRIFRALHSIKGSSAFLGLAAIETLGHHLETLLDLLRQGKRNLTPCTVDALLQCVDLLNKMVRDPKLGADTDLSPTLTLLEPLIAGSALPEVPPPPKPVALDSATIQVRAASSPAPVAAPSLSSMELRLNESSATIGRAPAHETAADDDKQMRVRVRFLDDLLQLTGNMVMARNQLLSKYNFADDPAFLTLSQCVTQVHKTIVQTRMQPIGTLFDRCERLVRDLSRQLDKEVNLEVDGRALELDRSVLEAFSDPLTHLIRNALDHGLEPAAMRQATGKPRAGQLKLTAREQAGEVILSVEDDGRGIDPEVVREKVVSRGLLSVERAANLTPRAILDYIFRPGFSTRDNVTSLSGRGVGLDVVRTNLESLGGVVEVQSTPGKGTAFIARLPLTQALVSSSLISALVVTCGGDRYAIPQTAVDEIIKVDMHGSDRDRVRMLNGQLVYQLRDLVLPVVPLHRVLGNGTAADEPRILIVLQFRGHLFGVLTDAVLGVEEIVVRPLPALVKTCKVFSGHTVMGDGQVALILDSNGIIDAEQLVFADEATTTPLMAVETRDRADGPQRLVVFSYSEDEYFAIPLEMVSLIEKVPLANIRRVGPHEYIQVMQRTLPLMRLDKVMAVGALPRLTEAYLLVPARVSFPIAVLAGRHIEVVEIAEKYESRLSDGQGMLGTFVHGNKLVVLLDLYKLFERHSPDRFKLTPVEKQPAHVLVAEDSPFFQNLIKSYLEHPPRRLTVANDGAAALDLLRAHPEEYDLLVSDIEMPRMDGFQLVQKVRSDPDLRGMPVIAVTSLANPEHIERGLREGFDSYLIKIDKEQLVSTIDRFLERGSKHRAGLLARKKGG